MRLRQSYAKRRARIEIIPLIDIIFFLLATFVMVSLSMIKNTGVPVHLPTAATASRQERNESVTISITKDGEVYFEKSRVTDDQLKARLNVWKAPLKDPQIFIHGDEETSFKHMVHVMDIIRSLGIYKVSMQTRPAEERRQS